MDKCRKCGNTEFYTEQKSTHLGLYCNKCNTWIKWVKQNNDTNEVASEQQQKYAKFLLNKWRLSKTPLLLSEASAIITALKKRFGDTGEEDEL